MVQRSPDLFEDYISVSEAARRLGMKRPTLYDRMREWGVPRYCIMGIPRLRWTEVKQAAERATIHER